MIFFLEVIHCIFYENMVIFFCSINTYSQHQCVWFDLCMQPDLENKCTYFNEQICVRSQNSPVDLSSQILQRLQITKYTRASVNKNVQSSLPSLMLKRETKKLVSFYYQCLTDILSVLLSDHVYIYHFWDMGFRYIGQIIAYFLIMWEYPIFC